MTKNVHLVLGSGGARGMAHISIIEMLLEEGYQIVDVVGCSMGAVVGGMYCAGHLDAYRDWLLAQTKSDIYRLFDLAFSRAGLVKGERIFSALKQMAGEQQIEALPIPFTAVATDLLTHTEVQFSKGDLYKALRASTGIPGVFTPVAWHDHLFVDGGVLNPLPINLVHKRSDAIIVAVNLNGAPILEADEARAARKLVSARAEEAHRYLTLTQDEQVKDTEVEPPAVLSMFELLDAAYDATMDRLVSYTLELYPPDVLIEIPRSVCSVFDFHRAADVFEHGRRAYRRAMGPRLAPRARDSGGAASNS